MLGGGCWEEVALTAMCGLQIRERGRCGLQIRNIRNNCVIWLYIRVKATILVAIYYHDWSSITPFVTASAIAFLLGLFIRNKKVDFDYLNNLREECKF